MIANSYGNANNRVLILVFALLFASSLGWNIKQLFDISNYKKVLYETGLLIENVMINNPVTTIGNAILTVAHLDIPPPPPIVVKQDPNTIQLKDVKKVDLQCLSENIYYEAGNQGMAGKVAVGHVTLNRVGKSGYPKTVCGVINHKINEVCMFSWKCTTVPPINYNSVAWKQSYQVAYDLLSKERKDMIDITEGATHFHNNTVRPQWKMRKVTNIGDHTFYR